MPWRFTEALHTAEVTGLVQKLFGRSFCESLVLVFTARRYASAVLAVVVCPSVCLSVCPSVCLSQAGIVSKRQHIESRKQRRTVAQGI